MIITLYTKFFLLLLFCASFFAPQTVAFYGDPNIPTTIPSTYGSLALPIGKSIYIIGGMVMLYNGSNIYVADISVISFSSEDEMQVQTKTPINPPKCCYPCYGYVLPDGDTIAVANIPYPSYNITQNNVTNTIKPGGLGYYHISNNTWTYGRNFQITDPISPFMLDFNSVASIDKKFIYILGGSYQLDALYINSYVFKYEVNNSSNFQKIDNTIAPSMFSGCSVALPSGLTVTAFGSYASEEIDIIDILNSTAQVLLFDQKTEAFSSKQISADRAGKFPVGRIYASCMLGPDNSSIYYFGGSDSIPDGHGSINNYNITVYNDIVILDTNTWSWVLPTIPGLQPLPAAETSMALFDTDKLFIGTGRQGGGIYTGSISVLDNVPVSRQSLKSSNLKWFTNNPKYDNPRKYGGLSNGAIAGIVVAMIIFFGSLIAILWIFVPGTKKVAYYIQQDLIWSPRSGEPLWAETSRLLVRFVLWFLFVAFIAFVIWKSVNSAIVTQQIKTPVDSVLAPDIRFCFDGFDQTNSSISPFVTCVLRNGTNCSGKILPLNVSELPPVSSFGTLSCFLFLPGLNYYLNSDNGKFTDSAGTKIKFSFFAQNTTSDITKGVIYVDFYPPGYDPNTVMYNITKLEDTKLSQTLLDKWVASQQANNVVTTVILKQTVISTASYTLTTTKTLRTNDGWNYIGFSSDYDESVTIDTTFKEVPQNEQKMPAVFYNQPIADLTVEPSAFTDNSDVEQRVFTLLNAFAQAGGVLGLFVAIQTILFGFRPQSPWGIVHRWSFGTLKVKLTDRLANYFNIMGTPVPLVNPVSNRLSTVNGQSYFKDDENTYVPFGPPVPSANDTTNEVISEEERVQRVEERLQLMELLLKSYYLNDEVFRSLDQAVKRSKQEGYQNNFGSPGNKDSDSALNNNNVLNEEFKLHSHPPKEDTSGPELNRRPSSTVFPQREVYQPRLTEPDPIELFYDESSDHDANEKNH